MTRAVAGDVALMRYHEIVLKGRNRPYFVRRLADHVARLVADLPVGAVDRASSRLLLPVHDVACWPELRSRLGRVFGLANFALAVEVPLDTLAAPGAERQETWNFGGTQVPVAMFPVDGHVIWGVTQRITRNLLDVLAGDEGEN